MSLGLSTVLVVFGRIKITSNMQLFLGSLQGVMTSNPLDLPKAFP